MSRTLCTLTRISFLPNLAALTRPSDIQRRTVLALTSNRAVDDA